MPSRYRADLIDVAWAKEPYGKYDNAPLAREIITLLQGGPNASTTGMLRGQWGLVTGGIDLPNPTYDWQPFYGLGVVNRNMLFPIQGRERLEGRVSQTLLCHDSSRLWLEQMIGLIFNGKNADSITSANTTYSPTSGAAGVTVLYDRVTTTGVTITDYTVANLSTDPTHIIILADKLGENPDRTQDTWAYCGTAVGSNTIMVFKDETLDTAGFNGIRPLGGTNQRWSVHGIGRAASDTSTSQGATDYRHGNNVTADADTNKVVIVRPTLVQPSFRLGARFRADDGSNFITNYSGCKVSRAVFNFEEGQPVNFGADFIARDMSHNIGEDDGSGSTAETLKYKASGTSGDVTYAPNYMKDIRVTEQPYFYSTVNLTFQGEKIARFRRFTITIDNGLDPRYYVTQNSASATRDNRQVLHEILEGRRNISFGGSLDMDNDGSTGYPVADSPTDAQFVRYLLNQGLTGTDIRDMNTLKGIGIEVELRQMTDRSATGLYNKIIFKLPSTTSSDLGNVSDVGMVLRSAPLNVPAPPSIHVPMDIDGMTASLHIEFLAGVTDAATA